MEKTRGHVAARRIDQFECGAVGAKGVRPAKSGHEHGLLLGFVDHHLRGRSERGGHRRVGHEQFAFRQGGEKFCRQRTDFLDGNVAENGQNAVLGCDAFVAEGQQLFASQGFDRFLRAVGAQAVRMIPENRPAHGVPCHRGDLFVLRLDGGGLVFFFALDFLVRKLRMGQDVRQNLHPEPQIGLHHFDGDTETVVAGVGADLSAHGLDLVIELFGCALLGALDQRAGGESGDAVGCGALGQKTAAENSDKVDQGKFVVRADENAQSVGQGEFFDFPRGARRGGCGRVGQRALWVEGCDRRQGFPEVALRHALQIGCFDASDLLQIFRAEIGIAGQQPASADVGGAAARGAKIAQLVRQNTFARLGHFFRSGSLRAVALDDPAHGLLRLGALFRIAEKIDAEEPHLAGHVGIRRDVVDEILFFAQFEVQGCAATAAQHGGQHVERRGVGMGDRRDMPDDGTSGQFGLELLVHCAASQLRRLVLDEKRRLRLTGGGSEVFFRPGKNLRRIHVSRHNKEHVLRRVTRAVIGDEILAGQTVENLEVSDDRMPVGTGGEGRGEHQLGAHAVRVVEAHGEFAADHFLFLDEFFGGQSGVERGIGEKLHRRACAVGRDINPINRAVERRVGVDIAAGFLHGAGDFVRAALLRALEDHVLEQVGQSGAEPLSLVDAAALHPDLHTGHRRGMVGLDQHGEAVGQHAAEGASAGQRGGGRVGVGQEVLHGGSARGRPRQLVSCATLRERGVRRGFFCSIGRKGARKASSKLNPFSKSSMRSSSARPKTPASMRLKTMRPTSPVERTPQYSRTVRPIGPNCCREYSRNPSSSSLAET